MSFSFRALVEAPSNIAVIKYMGKADSQSNLPANPSLSLTLDRLASVTEVSWSGPGSFALEWQGVDQLGGELRLRPMALPASDDHQRSKMERHLRRVFMAVAPELDHSALGQWRVRTGNRFPAGAGIASSASGFAAFTFGVACVLSDYTGRVPSTEHLSELSRQGSGSSCRSFWGPWVSWEGNSARPLAGTGLKLVDLIVLLDERAKAVSSSEAHERVKRSPLWEGRVSRAQVRFDELSAMLLADQLQSKWARFSELCFEEAMDMHELFHTAQPAFSYLAPRTWEILDWLRQNRGPPIAVTLDAGPNIHLLMPESELESVKAALFKGLGSLDLLEDRQGTGVRRLGPERGQVLP